MSVSTVEPTGVVIDESHYEDTGCSLHPSCLTCPRAVCIYDTPGEFRALFNERDLDPVLFQRIYRAVTARKWTITKCAAYYKVGEKRVRRALEWGRANDRARHRKRVALAKSIGLCYKCMTRDRRPDALICEECTQRVRDGRRGKPQGMHGRGVCRECGKSERLRANGLIIKHGKCPGSGMLPMEGSVKK